MPRQALGKLQQAAPAPGQRQRGPAAAFQWLWSG
jgi:hypothetical protein